MDELVEKAKAKGYKIARSTAEIVYYETRSVLKTLVKLGHLDDKFVNTK